ncbi:hypothetical protein DFJ58DRAFT_682285 [Suillus subalutaceus]|uniref:uncharacterized protein n=1 Tax=Suillus subalutaceus TaxID=48586 RepID=UPI001B86F2F0|nr:uncharacterized protein DFJ58DRAFT_682285 [Suillus subalutaceus]KAG1859589.1 hypothetical protein DFJ58DRAFT_682285 [Suillus subalutaceus]
MIIHGKNNCMFISWLRCIVKTAALRSYRSFLSVLLRLIRHCQSIVNGKEDDFRERSGGLALSSQPGTNQPDSEPAPPVSLAVPLLEAPLQSLHSRGSQPQVDIQNLQMTTPGLHGGSNDAVFNTDSPKNSSVPSTRRPSFASEPSIPEVDIATPQRLVAPGQTFDIILTPITPEQVNRYHRNVRVKDEFKAFLVEKGPLDCSEELAPVAGWEPLTQPEGALIFYQSHKRVLTDANVRNPETTVKIDKAVEKAYEEARNANIPLDPSVELGLELIVENDEEMWGYYFVDHERRVIFWFEDYLLMNNVRGVERKSHIKYALEYHYWAHIELFPNKRSLPEDIVVELKELVLFAQADSITSPTSLTRFTSDQIASILSLVDLLTSKSIPDAGSSLIVFSASANNKREHSVWTVARFMGDFCNTKFLNFCGQPGARLDVDQSLYGESDASSKNMLFRAMNVILFGSPDAQSRAFHKILVDLDIVEARWKQYMDKLNSDWNGYTIFSTVMLAVDISFLSVPSVQTQTPAILLSYMSTLCAMGSLVVTLLLVGQVNKSLRDPRESVSFLLGMSRSVLGFESFPLMLSLPFGLLIWGIVFFAAALSVVIFRTSGIVIISIAYPVWVAIVILAMWPVLAANRIHVGSLLRDWFRMWYWNTKQLIVNLWYQLYTWYWITGQYIFHLWHRIIEQVSPTVTTPSHV